MQGQNHVKFIIKFMIAGPSGGAVHGIGPQPPVCWDCGFESYQGHGCLLWVLCVVRQRSLRRA